MSAALSPQETRLYGLLLQDIRMKEIAHLMGLSKSTIDTYAANIYKKKNVQSRIGLVIEFYRGYGPGQILSEPVDSKAAIRIDMDLGR